jgi:Tfp pilus assembly ATPase PilU
MQTLDGHLLELYRGGTISFEMALSKCSNPSEFSVRAGDGRPIEELIAAGAGQV